MMICGDIPFDCYKFIEVFRLGRNTSAGVYETRSPPSTYRALKDSLGSLTVLLSDDESIEKDSNLRIVKLNELEKKRPRLKLDVWVVFDFDLIGVPPFIPRYISGMLKPGGRVILVRKKVLIPTIGLGVSTGVFMDAGFKHAGWVDLSPYIGCDVFFRRGKR